MSKKGIIFDLDGTLWDTSKQVVPAWNTVFERYSEINTTITVQDMKSFMGKTIEEIGAIIFPDLEEKKKNEILKDCCKEEQTYLSKYGGILYPNLEETLKKLSPKYSLYIVSNCQDGYVQTFLQYHKLEMYFEDIEMSGRTGKKKGENIRLIMKRNCLEKEIYIGDTMGDQESANAVGIPFVYAKYGFGKLDYVKYSINRIEELPELVNRLLT